MDYNAWRITFQDPEQAAQAAYRLAMDKKSLALRYKRNLKEARNIIDDITEQLERVFERECWEEPHEKPIEVELVRALVDRLHAVGESKDKLRRQMKVIKDQAIKQAAELLEREAEVRKLREQLEVPRSDNSPIHHDFGLSRASWLVAPRVILEAMPLHWQKRVSRLEEELHARFDWNPDGLEFFIQAKQNGRFVRMPHNLNNYRHPNRQWLESIDRTKQKEPADG